MRPTTHRLLQGLARLYPCVVISGRALADISRRLEHVPLWYVFGNHGSEPMAPHPPTERTRHWVETLERALPTSLGTSIEDKRHTVTVHYRGAPDAAAAQAAILQAARALPDVRIVGGDHAINLLRRDAPDKGTALAYAVRAFACTAAMYVGDDDTDEDAFGALPPDQLLSIRVGASPTTRARFQLASQIDIDALLNRLISLRGAGDASPHTGAETVRT